MQSSHNPTVSAIISTYNSERFIRGCIEDLEYQTIADSIELIVIDSGSMEREGKIVRELQHVYPNIRYIRTEQRETVYAAWNRAIAVARGRFITNANTDDRRRRDALEIMSGILDDNPAVDLVYADVLITRTPNETFVKNTAVGRYNWFPWDRNILLDKGCFIGPQPMWRRSLHDIYGFFDPCFTSSGDYEFWLRISQTSDFHYMEEPLGLYLKHPESVEHRNEEKKFLENRRILARYRQAADDAALVAFLPFQRLRDQSNSVVTSDQSSNLAAVMQQINDFVNRGSSPLPPEYDRLFREVALGNAHAGSRTYEKYIRFAEKSILDNMEWFSRRRTSPKSTYEESELRTKVLAGALADARTLFQHGDIEGAVDKIINTGIKAAPSSPSPYADLAGILISAGRYEEALQVVPEMPPATDPGLVRDIEAACHAAVGNDTEAEQAACDALSLGVEHPRSLVVLGTLAARRGELGEAERFFRRAAIVDPAYGEAWLSLGMLLWSKGQVDSAFDALCRFIDTGPINGEAIAIFIDMARRLGRLNDAGRILMKSSGNYPENRLIAAETTQILSELGRYGETLQCAESFLVKFGHDDTVLDAALSARKELGPQIHSGQGKPPSLSLCMIVKNEERRLARCLASVAPLVHEMVVVDTGSSDRTLDIATAFGANVHNFSWNGNFSDARNFALSKSRGTWILVLDADEVISAKDHELIRKALISKANHKTAWSVNTRNYITTVNTQGWTANDGLYPDEEAADGWHPSRKVRLFPNVPAIRFRGVVHEMVETSLREQGYEIKDAQFVVHHYGALEIDKERIEEKRRLYFEIGKRKLEKNPDDLAALTELAVQAGEMGSFDEAIRLWNRVLELAPYCVEALFNKGYALIMQKHYAEALEVSRKAVELDPTHKEALFNYGTCELYVGNARQALERLRPLLAKNRMNPQLLALMLVLCLAEGEVHEAKESFVALKKLNCAFDDYVHARVDTLIVLGHSEKAHVITDGLRKLEK